MDKKLLAFHSDPAIKEKYLARVIAHRKADEIVQSFGYYWTDGKGCAIGCTLHSSNHHCYETELGIPMQIAYVEDRIFEKLPVKLAKKWPEKVLKAIKPGADLNLVIPKFLYWLLLSKTDGMINLCKSEDAKITVRNIGKLIKAKIKGIKIIDKEWKDAARSATAAAAIAAGATAAAAIAAGASAIAAASCAAYDARSAAYAASATDAARSAASATDAAAYAASATDAAAYAASAAGCYKNAIIKQSKHLLKLLRKT